MISKILKSVCIIIYSFLLSISLFYTDKINSLKTSNALKNSNYYILTKEDFEPIIQIFPIVFILVLISILLFKYIKIGNQTVINFSIKKIVAFFFIAWFPFLLVFFPTVGMNDAYYILHSPLNLSTIHPFFYNYFIAIPSKISFKIFNTMTYGLFISVIIQMIFMAFSISYTISWLNERLKNKYIIYLLIVYFAFTPLIVNYSIATVKDTIFSVVIMLWIPFLYEIFVENKKIFTNKFTKYYFCFIAFMTMAMRNNGKYIFIPLLLLLFYKCITERKILLKYGIIIFIICNLPNFYLSVFRDRPQLFQEAIAIPIQQLARTIAINGELDKNQKIYLNNLLPLEKINKQYDPFSVDTLKWDQNFNRSYLQQTKNKFIEIWFTGLKHNTHIYIDAWVLQTFACWANKTQDWESQSKFGYILTDEVLKSNTFPTQRPSYSPIIIPQSISEILGNYLLKHSDFINPGNCFWLIGYITLLLIFKNKYYATVILLPLFLCWFSLMIAVPLSFAYRYAFMYPLCLPFLIFIPFIQNQNNGDNQNA